MIKVVEVHDAVYLILRVQHSDTPDDRYRGPEGLSLGYGIEALAKCCNTNGYAFGVFFFNRTPEVEPFYVDGESMCCAEAMGLSKRVQAEAKREFSEVLEKEFRKRFCKHRERKQA